MQQPSTNDYINWLRMQDSQLAMEEAQLAAEEQWLQQALWAHNNNTSKRFGQTILFTVGKMHHPTPWQQHGFQLRDKQNELQLKRSALNAKQIWLQQEKAKYNLP